MFPSGFHRDWKSGSALGVVWVWLTTSLALFTPSAVASVLTTSERAELIHNSFLESRRDHLSERHNPYTGPALAQAVEDLPGQWNSQDNPWHNKIRATVFWVGETPTERNPVPNTASSWDPHWELSYGGFDDPTPIKRAGYRPLAFEPKLNPFYVALPYNDLLEGREHRPEAAEVIPWFWRSYRGPGVSVCHNRWIAIHHQGRIAYAQWKDVGPFTIDDWPYVFKGESPRNQSNEGAGIDLSPAVRDFLGMKGNADVDWRFVEEAEVPNGPWSKWIQESGSSPGSSPISFRGAPNP